MKKQYQDTTSVTSHLIFITLTVSIILAVFILVFVYNQFLLAPPIDASVLVSQARNGLMPKPLERFIFVTLALTVPIILFLISLMVFFGINKRCMLGQTWLKPRTAPEPLCSKTWLGHVKSQLPIWFKPFLTIPHPAVRAIFDKRISTNVLLLRELINRQFTGILVVVTAALVYFPLIGFDFSRAYLLQDALPTGHPVSVLLMTWLVASVWYVWHLSRDDRARVLQTGRLGMVIIWAIFAAIVLLQLGAWRILSDMSITQEDRWQLHADAVFYTIGQVMAGKTLLVDLPSQYGLYPEFLMPIFKLVGFSVFHFTIVCAVLQFVSLASVYWVVSRFVRDLAIKVTFGLSLVMVTFATIGWLLGTNDPYFQYWPTRFFWPAEAILFFYYYSTRPTWWRALQVSLVGSVGALWNMDSGLVIVLAFAGVLSAKWLVLWFTHDDRFIAKRRQLRNALIVHVATCIIVTLVMFGYLILKGAGPLNLDWLIGYQKVFYGLGFMMMPMPLTPSPWMSVIGIYLLALIVAARSWAFNPQSKHADLLVFISLMGLGLFIYYEGRAHPLNLIAVCWPVLVLVALLADRVQRAIRTGLLSRQHLIFPIAALSVLLFCSLPLVFSFVKLGKQVESTFKHLNLPADKLVRDELNFILANTTPGEECVIVSRRQGLYYAETGTASPISGPGFTETILQRDRDEFIDNLLHQRYRCLFIGVNKPLNIANYWYPIVINFVAKLHETSTAEQKAQYNPEQWIKSGDGTTSAYNLGIDLMTELNGYKIVASNAQSTLLFLVPKHAPSS